MTSVSKREFYLLHVIGREVPGEFDKLNSEDKRRQYLKANLAAINNYAWYHELLGNEIDSTVRYQCFDPDVAVRSWWRQSDGTLGPPAEDVMKQRIQSFDWPIIQRTEYRAGQDDGCDPPFAKNADGDWMMSQLDATSCADAGWRWYETIDRFYGPNGWTRQSIAAPYPPVLSTQELNSSKVRVEWDSPTGYAVWVYRRRWDPVGQEWNCQPTPCDRVRYAVRYNEIVRFDGTIISKGCRCIPRVVVEDNLSCGTRYSWATRAWNPKGESPISQVVRETSKC